MLHLLTLSKNQTSVMLCQLLERITSVVNHDPKHSLAELVDVISKVCDSEGHGKQHRILTRTRSPACKKIFTLSCNLFRKEDSCFLGSPASTSM